jgi:hypothetical protein
MSAIPCWSGADLTGDDRGDLRCAQPVSAQKVSKLAETKAPEVRDIERVCNGTDQGVVGARWSARDADCVGERDPVAGRRFEPVRGLCKSAARRRFLVRLASAPPGGRPGALDS